ncbi:hypothetical protein C4569_00165 [Candidatus Parcubacteria bacterium]|nr:MAG: hypothetical protein C4569_00165 [Candidatus Parcubacteria bacterium]
MRLALKIPDNINVNDFFRKCGYAVIFAKEKRSVSYVKRLTGNYYPRIHIYVRKTAANMIIDIHLDQKKVKFKDKIIHAGDYGGGLLESEAAKIKNNLKKYK